MVDLVFICYFSPSAVSGRPDAKVVSLVARDRVRLGTVLVLSCQRRSLSIRQTALTKFPVLTLRGQSGTGR